MVKKQEVAPGPRLIALADALQVDTKVGQFFDAIDDLIRQDRQSIVFTFSRRTLRYLERNLVGRARVATLHGGIAPRERGKVMADFRDGQYDVLLATKVADAIPPSL